METRIYCKVSLNLEFFCHTSGFGNTQKMSYITSLHAFFILLVKPETGLMAMKIKFSDHFITDTFVTLLLKSGRRNDFLSILCFSLLSTVIPISTEKWKRRLRCRWCWSTRVFLDSKNRKHCDFLVVKLWWKPLGGVA